MNTIDSTLKERGDRYGDFTHHAHIAQELQNTMRTAGEKISGEYWDKLSDVQRQALTVIADKIARILSGDPNYLDSVRDIMGYSKLMLDRMDVDGATDTKTIQIKKVDGEWVEQA